jgi:hypothetical protein
VGAEIAQANAPNLEARTRYQLRGRLTRDDDHVFAGAGEGTGEEAADAAWPENRE